MPKGPAGADFRHDWVPGNARGAAAVLTWTRAERCGRRRFRPAGL